MGVAIGFSVSFGILLFGISVTLLVRRWRRDIEKKVRGKYFRENQGLLLEQLLSSDENATEKTKIFSLEQLEKATNNFDRARILSEGVAIGFSVSFRILLFGVSVTLLVRRWRRDIEKKVRGKYLWENQGLLLEQLLSPDENAIEKTKIFSLE
ncbi:unnamed protein product [Miscanthus lutarioriparius]|uniref:Uncharacterized protein n=1 Tax=Miscanthus lutarioriparius TaxID=422564 RepID=A0A811NQX6_9POAL|nr:unnamed protein product [Miscanthus lutarioriparius]